MKKTYQHQNQAYTVDVQPGQHGKIHLVMDHTAHQVEVLRTQGSRLIFATEKNTVEAWVVTSGRDIWVAVGGKTYRLQKTSPNRRGAAESAAAQNALYAPMPAQVREIQVQAGQEVVQGQTLLILEAMKMEIRIQSPQPAVVVKVLVSSEQIVEKDQLLVELEPITRP